MSMTQVRMWEEKVLIPTYSIGEPDKNPIFLDKRVYQGSSGKIYPYPTVEKICDEKKDQEYKAVFLENEYLKIMILPELGGRIQRAYDKTNGYDFVYYNKVIKPALVGLTGPWISGGIEFNWPQHHRPTTFMPVDYRLVENSDKSKTLKVNDVDQINGTKGEASFTLYPGRAYIEIKGQLYNRTSMPQTFLWWANPAVAVNENTQSIFPPDVHAVMDHGKRDVSRFPIATGVYYKHDYSAGVDISRYRNIPVPTSYMAEKSDYNFVGGYDYKVRAGLLHVADHHISPGKKQWTWGCGDFGKAWDRNLTDEDGPYIELMTGVFTDNQPDFTWLKPFEEKAFTQYFMPYKAAGPVKNASVHCAVNLESNEEGVYLCVYASEKYERAKVLLTYEERKLLEREVLLSPVDIFEATVEEKVEEDTKLSIEVWNGEELLVAYRPQPKEIPRLPEPAEAAREPKELRTNEELYLTGIHIEQYRHATYLPDPYYLEGLRRDPEDIRINTAYGTLLMRRGCFGEAEECFRKALKRATWKNPNPYNSEPCYYLGLALWYQEKEEKAYDAFYKAVWSAEQQEMSYYYLSCIEARRKNYESALELIEKSLVKNTHNIKARGLKAYLFRKLGRYEEAGQWLGENLRVDSFDYLSMYENSMIDDRRRDEILADMKQVMRGFHENYLQAARDYAEYGAYEEAIEMIRTCGEERPMLRYYEACYQARLGGDYKELLERAQKACPDYCFPNKLEDIAVLRFSIARNPSGSRACYYLGNLYYDKLQHAEAVRLWEEAVRLEPGFSIPWRNLALAYYNKLGEKEKAKNAMEKAYLLASKDARIFLELDQLHKKLRWTAQERISEYDTAQEVYIQRDDLVIEYITLLNMLGRHEEAYELTMGRKFHPWEGGEGKITTQYTISLVELARKEIARQEYGAAREYLERAFVYPENLGEGKLEGTKDNHINYYMGYVMEKTEEAERAKEYYEKASVGTDEPAGMMYYNDQPADMIYYQGLALLKLGRITEANSRFYKLLDYGEKHIFDCIKVEYFAVSLPDFMIFDDDLDMKNKAHCNYLMGLGYLGLEKRKEASRAFREALRYEPAHLNCIRYLKMTK